MTLPKEWIDLNKLQKNSEVELETGQNSISINLKESHPSKEVTISYPLPKEENIVADITGAYLLGYDIIKIKAKTTIPKEERELIRNSMRRLVGMEIVEEDATTISMQFLLDSTTLNPQKILKRISNLVLGMFNDVLSALKSEDRSNLLTLANRDIEVNRQYFLLVRLIRNTMVDKRLANAFNLENIDVLDYRLAANLLETAGDTVVELGNSLYNATLSKSDLDKIYEINKNFEMIESKSIDAFINNDRKLAIEAIVLHKKYQSKVSLLRSSIESKKQIPIDYLDLVYMFERIEKSWSDIIDLVKPTYLTYLTYLT